MKQQINKSTRFFEAFLNEQSLWSFSAGYLVKLLPFVWVSEEAVFDPCAQASLTAASFCPAPFPGPAANAKKNPQQTGLPAAPPHCCREFPPPLVLSWHQGRPLVWFKTLAYWWPRSAAVSLPCSISGSSLAWLREMLAHSLRRSLIQWTMKGAEHKHWRL